MPTMTPAKPIVALLYSEGRQVDPIMEMIARYLTEAGCALAGFLQRERPRIGRSRCDMVLEELASGEAIAISQDRGPNARGCRLDMGEMLRAMRIASEALAQRPDLVIINKFGKTEGEGGGFRPLIAEAMEAGVPILVAVPWRNIDGWRSFAGEFAVEHRAEDLANDAAAACRQLGLIRGDRKRRMQPSTVHG